jgi:hypothetical protein
MKTYKYSSRVKNERFMVSKLPRKPLQEHVQEKLIKFWIPEILKNKANMPFQSEVRDNTFKSYGLVHTIKQLHNKLPVIQHV